MRQRLLRVPDVSKVELFGVQDEKVFIEISQKRLAQLGLDFNQVLSQLGQQNAIESAGAVQTPLDVVQVRVAGQFEAVEQLRAMPIRGAGYGREPVPEAASCVWVTSLKSGEAMSIPRLSRFTTRARK